jgi:hypothetical protein
MTQLRWLQCVTPFPGDFSIQDRFDALFMAALAPEDCALFCRTSEDYKSEIFLLTPQAARFASMLPGKWETADDPSQYGWSLLVANGDAFKRFGLSTPRDLERRDQWKRARPESQE